MEEHPIDDKEQINPNVQVKEVAQQNVVVAQERPQGQIDYFIPPPINYLNSGYYQYLKGSDDPMKRLTEHYTILDEKYEVNNTPPKPPDETQITSQFK